MNEDIVEYKEIPLIQCPFCGSNDIVSQRGNQQRMCMGCGAEGPEAKSRQGADALWNRRTPEPGTSVLHWTRYDGTKETLPDRASRVLLSTDRDKLYADEAFFMIFSDGSVAWQPGNGKDIKPVVGDLWTHWPTPESMK